MNQQGRYVEVIGISAGQWDQKGLTGLAGVIEIDGDPIGASGGQQL